MKGEMHDWTNAGEEGKRYKSGRMQEMRVCRLEGMQGRSKAGQEDAGE